MPVLVFYVTFCKYYRFHDLTGKKMAKNLPLSHSLSTNFSKDSKTEERFASCPGLFEGPRFLRGPHRPDRQKSFRLRPKDCMNL
jgi:hypothetical protein